MAKAHLFQPKTIYTIAPDYGGAYGWIIRDGDESNGWGPCIACSSGWGGDHPISEGLHQKFADWQLLFERDVDPLATDNSDFDWLAFHARGLQLCVWLKQEIGDAARVIYEKPFEDPNSDDDNRLEVLQDGVFKQLLNRMEVYCISLSLYVKQIISGGHTGADRAAIDWAIVHSITHGGWYPADRAAEDSDGTLILNLGPLNGGSLETQRFAENLKKPCLVVQLDNGWNMDSRLTVIRWMKWYSIRRLNIAGPRESKCPGIYDAVLGFLEYLDQGYDFND